MHTISPELNVGFLAIEGPTFLLFEILLSDITSLNSVDADRISKCWGELLEIGLFLFKGIFDKGELTIVIGERILMFVLFVESHCGLEEELPFE